MLFYSTNRKAPPVTFREAVFTGLAPDGGLWMPSEFPLLISSYDAPFAEIAYEISRKFIGDEIPSGRLKDLTENAIHFDAPIVRLAENTSVLELFHGPTLAFKDFGAAFMAHIVSHFLENSKPHANVLVATSGDTGSAVAHAFYRMPGIRVIVLYPSRQVSAIQESQITTLGENITALEVSGTFDDCQNLVKRAFQDPKLRSQTTLISANSINIARLLPQCFYYFHAWSQLSDSPVVFSVPSGNFGNLTAGLFSKRIGLPVRKFIAATNVNDTVPRYLRSGVFEPRPSTVTLSNAMDVGNPSNFARILALYDSKLEEIRADISGYSFTDEQTREGIKELYERYKYIADPHSAIAYLGWKAFDKKENGSGIFLSTAHPSKFKETIEQTIGIEVKIPDRMQFCLSRQKQSTRVPNDYAVLRDILLS